jgi:hypothetical protein
MHGILQAESEVRKQLLVSEANARVQQDTMERQQAAAQPMIDQNRAMQHEDEERGAAMEIGGRVLDEESKDRDHQRALELEDARQQGADQSAQADHGRRMVEAEASDNRKLSLEREKAKMKPPVQPKKENNSVCRSKEQHPTQQHP